MPAFSSISPNAGFSSHVCFMVTTKARHCLCMFDILRSVCFAWLHVFGCTIYLFGVVIRELESRGIGRSKSDRRPRGEFL